MRAMLVSVMLVASLTAQMQERVVEIRALNDFRSPRRQSGYPLGGSLLSGQASEHSRALVTGIGDPQGGVLDVPGILGRRHQAEVAAGRLELTAEQNVLLIRGEKALVEACLREIDALQAAVTRPIEVTAMLLPVTAVTGPGNVVGAEVVTELQRQSPPWIARARTRPGSEVALGREQWTPHVRDVDVEVAKGVSIGDPKVDAAMAGVRVVAAVHPLPEGDDALLIGWFAVGECVAMRESPTGVEQQPTVDLPEWRTASGTFAARIKNGGAAVVVARGAAGLSPSFTLVVAARQLGPAVSVMAPGVQVLPVSALCTETHLRRVAIGSAVPLPGEDGGFGIVAQEQLEWDSGQVSVDLLPRLVTSEGVNCTVHGGFLVVEAEPGREGGTAPALQRVCDQKIHNAEVRVELTDPTAKTPLLSMSQPVVLGREAWFFLGREQACIGDFEVEIGETASANNPVVRVAQAGIWSRLRLRPGTGALSCDALLQVAAQGPPRERPLQGKPPGTLGLITTDVAAFPWDAPIPPGRAHDLGDGPPFLIDGKVVPSRMSLQVSVR